MKYSEFEALNRFLTILDSCQISSHVEIETTLNSEELILLNEFKDNNMFKVDERKKRLIKIISENYDDEFYYHFTYWSEGVMIARGYDQCEFIILNPEYFIIKDIQKQELGDAEIQYESDVYTFVGDY